MATVNNAISQKTNFKPGALTAAVVVSDSERSIHFYKDIIGMHEVGDFTIDSVFAGRLGLSKNEGFEVTRLAFEDSPQGSQLKIVSFNKEIKEEAASTNAAIQNQLGLQYLTLQVYSLDLIMERVKNEGVTPQADTPLKLGDHSYLVLLRDPDGVFVEIIGDYTGLD